MKRLINPSDYGFALLAAGTAELHHWWTFRLETHKDLLLSPSDTASMTLLRSLQYHAFLDKVDYDSLVSAIRTFKARK